MMTCLFKSNSARYHRKAEGCRGDTQRVVMEKKKKTPTIRRNSRQSTDTRKVVKFEVDKEKVERNYTRKQIKWPKSNSSEWEKLDEDMSRRLKTIIAHPREKAETHPKIILAERGSERKRKM